MFSLDHNNNNSSNGRNEDQTSSEERELSDQKFRDITSYLMSAGYFRARDPKLSPFEKVVGGMCYCITQSHTSLDVDIFRSSSNTTGQNIKLAEALVHRLRSMRCPASLQAHQIHGSDWKQVHPAIVWLIKHMFEARDDQAAKLRKFSEQQFEKHFKNIEFLTDDSTKRKASPSVPERRFKYAGLAPKDEESQVFACLLEYGDSSREKKSSSSASSSSPTDAFEKAVQRAEKEEAKQEKRDEEISLKLKADMTKAGSLAKAQIGEMVRLGAGELEEARQRYEKTKTTTSQETDFLRERLVEARSAAKAAHEKADLTEKQFLEIKEIVDALITEKEEAITLKKKVEAEVKKLIAKEKNCDAGKKKDLEELKRLVAANETFKRREETFKADCKKKLAELKEELKKEMSKPADNEKILEIQAVHAKVVAKDARLRRQVAASSRAIATTARHVDDVPTRAELVQYERRFHELYAQVAAKLDETKKYYELYNSLDEICKIHAKEINVLNNVIDTFSEAMRTKQTKQTFLDGIHDINQGLKQQLTTKQNLFQKAQTKANDEAKLYHLLVEEHRKYHAAVKDFHDECQKNDLLLARIKQQQTLAA